MSLITSRRGLDGLIGAETKGWGPEERQDGLSSWLKPHLTLQGQSNRWGGCLSRSKDRPWCPGRIAGWVSDEPFIGISSGAPNPQARERRGEADLVERAVQVTAKSEIRRWLDQNPARRHLGRITREKNDCSGILLTTERYAAASGREADEPVVAGAEDVERVAGAPRSSSMPRKSLWISQRPTYNTDPWPAQLAAG